jgi:hypothetical protein
MKFFAVIPLNMSKPKLLLAFVSLLLVFSSFAQSKYTISGSIRDAKTGEELIGATVSVRRSPTPVPPLMHMDFIRSPYLRASIL